MIVVSAELDYARYDLAAATRALLALTEATRREQGCMVYQPSVDLSSSSRLLLHEVWASDEALQAHFTTPHMAEFQKVTKGLTRTSLRARKYIVEKEMDLFPAR